MNKKDHHSVTEQIAERYRPFADQVQHSTEPLPVNIDGFAPKANEASASLAKKLYTAVDLVGIPEPAINASIGCGNPHAIANIQAGEHVLDLGSGGGIDCFMAAKAVEPTGYVIGVDATPNMIELARKNQAKMGIDHVEFRLGKIEALPVESDSIDLIISNCVIDISPDKTAVFQEAFRVLKSGGRLSISDSVLMGNIPEQLKARIDIWAGAVITPLISLDAFLQYMIDAGFVDIQVGSLTSYGLENFDALDDASKETLTDGSPWTPLPKNTGLYSALIWAKKP